MNPEASDSASGPEAEDHETRINYRLAGIQRVTLLAGLGLVLAGSALEFIHDGHIGRNAVALSTLPGNLAALHGSGVLTLGLLVLLVAPAVGIAYLIGAMFRANDRLHALLATVVLAILIFSIVFKGAL